MRVRPQTRPFARASFSHECMHGGPGLYNYVTFPFRIVSWIDRAVQLISSLNLPYVPQARARLHGLRGLTQTEISPGVSELACADDSFFSRGSLFTHDYIICSEIPMILLFLVLFNNLHRHDKKLVPFWVLIQMACLVDTTKYNYWCHFSRCMHAHDHDTRIYTYIV